MGFVEGRLVKINIVMLVLTGKVNPMDERIEEVGSKDQRT